MVFVELKDQAIMVTLLSVCGLPNVLRLAVAFRFSACGRQ